MAGGIWTSPVDVGVEGVPTTLLTNIADDLRSLHKGNGQATITTLHPSSSYVVDIGVDDQTFLVYNDHDIRYITTAGREPGNTIHLIMSGPIAGQIGYNFSSPPSGSARIYGNGSENNSIIWTENRLITLVYSGLAWHHDMRFT